MKEIRISEDYRELALLLQDQERHISRTFLPIGSLLNSPFLFLVLVSINPMKKLKKGVNPSLIQLNPH